MNIEQITVPPRLAARPKDHRGFPIFYTVTSRDGVEIDFTSIDSRKVAQCGFQQICGLCGQSLVQTFTGAPTFLPCYFIGGPVSVLKTKIFQDPPMHRDCAYYAIAICPWMVLSEYRRRPLKDDVKFHRAGIGEIAERPPYLGMLRANGFQYFFDQNLFKASAPRQLMKLWRPGSDEKVSVVEATRYADKSMQKIQQGGETRNAAV